MIEHQAREAEALLPLRLKYFRDALAFFDAAFLQFQEQKAAEARAKADQSWEAIVFGLVDSTMFAFNVPNLFNRSLFLAAYSLLEHQLDTHARDLGRRLSVELQVDEIQGRGIERARLFIKKAANTPFPDTLPQWEEIRRFSELRNVLMHRFGRLDSEKDKRLQTWITKRPDLSVLPFNNAVCLESSFVVHVIDTIQGFFSELGYRFEE